MKHLIALVAAGVVALATGMSVAQAASPFGVDQILSTAQGEPGLFQFEIFQLPKKSGPTFLLKGADGNLWFSNINRHQIARFDIARRQLRTFPLHPTSQVLVMSNGPDGNVWYADFDGNRGVIARITPTGKITEFVMPHGRGAAGLGPDRTATSGSPRVSTTASHDLTSVPISLRSSSCRIPQAALARSQPVQMAQSGSPNWALVESDELRWPAR
jgi:streptogramin lyase